jgi:hypothetical protein
VVKANKGIVFGVILPVAAMIRYPPLIALALRFMLGGSQLILAGLVYTGNIEAAARLLWRRMVRLSEEKQKRSGRTKK